MARREGNTDINEDKSSSLISIITKELQYERMIVTIQKQDKFSRTEWRATEIEHPGLK